MMFLRTLRFSKSVVLLSSALSASGCNGNLVEEPAPAPPRSSPSEAVPVAAKNTTDVSAFKAALAPRLSRSIDGLSVVRGPDGRRRIDFRGRFASGHVVRTEPDGTSRIQCITSAAELETFLSERNSR